MTPMAKRILKHLWERGSISNVEAQAIYKCRALPRRIKDLKEMGTVIVGTWKTDATGQRYKRYEMLDAPRWLIETHVFDDA